MKIGGAARRRRWAYIIISFWPGDKEWAGEDAADGTTWRNR